MDKKQLQALIKHKYGTLGAYTKKVGLSTSTVNRIFDEFDGVGDGTAKISTMNEFLNPLGYEVKTTIIRKRKKK